MSSLRPEEDRTSGSPELLVDVVSLLLKSQGITTIFGIPGGLIHPFFDRIEQDEDFSLIVARHEGGAAFMADGFARAAGTMAVAAATSGPGATNLLTGVAAAHVDGVPMLVITGQAPSHTLGKGAAQETAREDIDIVGMFAPVTKYSAMVSSPGQFALHFRRAITLALSGRPGPVHLNVPVDFWQQPAGAALPRPLPIEPAHPVDLAAVQRAAAMLDRAERPVLLAGAGASSFGARQLLEDIAALLGAPTATTPRGKGIFPEDHPLSLGVCGLAGSAAAQRELLDQSPDVLFIIGASMNETTTFNWHPGLGRNRHIIQLDIDPARIGRSYPADIALVGDAEATLAELIKYLNGNAKTSRRSTPPPSRHAPQLQEPAPGRSVTEPGRINPVSWRDELNDALPSNSIVFSDIGGHMLFNIQHLRIRGDQRFIINMGFGSMGHGTVAPIGAAVGCPDRPVIAIVGDACFTMNGMDLLTAREHDISAVWIVENNQSHGISYHGSRMVNGGRAMQCIINDKELGISAIARGMGIPAWEIRSPGELTDALHQAISVHGPAVIEVHVDPEVSPPLAERAKTVAGFRNN
ncbi:thiamine pyrophosphate-binding protein [Streptomyces sp. NPDC056480]|uniref:thiamine pyrophosphate-binding protein n=1 Tax=Streptomyces sp. NPDC056480 TaxID=3345833 RepID=UPI0036A154A1